MLPEGERVVTRGSISPLHAHIARPRFAPKSNMLVYWAKDPTSDGDRVFIVTPDRAVQTDIVEPGPVTFSDDGSRWGTVAPVREPIPGEVDEQGEPRFQTVAVVIIDGLEMGRWAHASPPSFSPDGKHVAFVFEDGRGCGAVFVDGVRRRTIAPLEGPCAPSAVTDNGTAFSILSTHYLPNGKLLALVRDRDGFTLYLDDDRLAAYPTTAFEGGAGFVVSPTEECRVGSAIAPRSFRVAEHGPVAAWWERVAGETEKWRVVRNAVPVDDVLCDRPWGDEPPQLSSDGRVTAYACVMEHTDKPDDVDVVTPGGHRHGPYHAIWGISFSDDGKRVTWGASDGTVKRPWSIVVDGKPLVEGFPAIFRPRFTPDGEQVVWQARRSGSGRSVLGIGTRRLASFDEVYWGPDFPARDRVAWIIRRGTRLVRVVADVHPPAADVHPH